MIKYQSIDSVAYSKINAGKSKKIILNEMLAMGYNEEETEDAYEFAMRDLMGWAIRYMRGTHRRPNK